MFTPFRFRSLLLPAIAALALVLLCLPHLHAAAGDTGPPAADVPPAAAPSSPHVVVQPVDLDALIAIGAAAGPLAIALQPLIAMLAALGRRRWPWFADTPRAVAVVAVLVADLVVLAPAIAGGTVTLVGAAFAIAINIGQIRYPDMLHRVRSSAGGGAAASTVTVLVVGAMLVACSSQAALQRHALAAQVMHDAAAGARDVVLEQLAADVAAATAGAGDPADRARAAAEVRARYMAPGGPVDRANAVNRLGLAYVRALLVLEQGERPTWSELGPPLRAALEAYADLRRVVGDRLPAVPSAVAGLVP